MQTLSSNDNSSRKPRRPRGGFTLTELVVSLGSASLLLLGTASALYLANQGLEGSTDNTQRRDAAIVLKRLTDDVHHAIGFTERTATAITFTVPDRDGNSQPETIRYNWTGPGTKQLTYELNNSPAVVLAEDVENFNLRYLTRFYTGAGTGGQQTTKVLLVVPDPGSLTVQDANRKAFLEGWGFTVNLIDDDDTQANFDTAVGENAVAYISEEASKVALGSKLANAAIGVVSEHANASSTYGFASSNSAVTDSQLNLTDNQHYITDGFATGWMAITNTSQPLTSLDGTLAPGLVALGELNDTPNPTVGLAVIPQGFELEGGGTAAGRRVQLPWGSGSFDITQLTEDAKTLLKRSIEWGSGLGDDGAPLPPANFGYETAFATAVNFSSARMLATQVTLPQDGDLTSITAYITGVPGKTFGFAIYADAGGEPANLVAQTPLGSGGGTEWKTQNVSATPLTAGTYWLVVTLDKDTHEYFREDTGGQGRIKLWNPIKDGWPASWGSSDFTNTYKISIYGTYSPTP